MKKQLIGILISISMLMTTIGPIIFTANQYVKATIGNGGNVGLDYENIYENLATLCNVVFNTSLEDYGIRKGRDFGTAGENWSAYKIADWMEKYSDNLTDAEVYKEPIGYSNSPSDQWHPRKSDIKGFQLLLQNGTHDPIEISTNESMPTVCYTALHYIFTKYYSSSGFCTLEPYPLTTEDSSDYKMFNVTYTRINDANNFSQMGVDDNIIYVENYSNASFEEKEGRIHLINVSNNELNETVNQIADANATGFLLIRNDISDIQGWEFPIPGLAVSDENGSLIKSYIQNESLNNISAEVPYDIPIPEQGILTIYFYNNTCQNQEKKILLVDAGNYDFFKLQNKSKKDRTVMGILFYSSTNDGKTHWGNTPNGIEAEYIMELCQGFKWGMERQWDSYSWLYKPWININRTIYADDGPHNIYNWVNESPTGQIKAKFLLNWTKNPQVQSYNVYCTVPGIDTSKTVIISGGHYDGFWGQMATDDASGVAVMLGVLKYMNDNHITPKCNLVFITFSGEEYLLKGSRGYVLRHWDDINSDKIECIINLDVLAHNLTDSTLYISNCARLQPLQRAIINTTVSKIAEWTHYETKNNNFYSLKMINANVRNLTGTPQNGTIPGTDAFPFWLRGITAINFGKEPYDEIRHQTGTNHTRGDTLAHIDRNDLNISSDLVWNISKYFCVFPDCHFESITTQKLDSPNDQNTDPDAVTITYAVHTTMPSDHVKVRAILTSQDNPILARYSNDAIHVVTKSIITSHTLTVSLPKSAPPGDYNLSVYLYNSTGEIDNILDNSYDQGIYADQSYYIDTISLTPPNDIPETPTTPTGPTEIIPWIPYEYSTSSTDPNNDRIQYQWQWTEGHNASWTLWSWLSGATASRKHAWNASDLGSIQIRVRAKDIWSHPDYCSPWSDPLSITVADGCWFDAPTETLLNEPVQFTGYAAGGIEPYTWEWKFSSTLGYEENSSTPTHTYNEPDSYPVSLKVTDDNDTTMYYNTTIAIKNIIAHYTLDSANTTTNTTQTFNDTSTVYKDYHIDRWTWDFGDGNTSDDRNVTYKYTTEGDYNVTLTVEDNQSHTDTMYQIIHVDSTPPDILAVRNTENTVAQGFPVTINAEVFDNRSDINTVTLNITTPDNTTGNYTMNYTETGLYSYIYTYTNTEQLGQYNYTIWVTDHAGNTNNTTGFSFTIVQQPYLQFITPTPSNNIATQHNWVYLNTTVQDSHNTSAFIDWNRNLKGYWPMDNYNNTGVHDNSTYNNFGKFYNGIGTSNIVTGKYGKALDFDGNDDYLDCGTDPSLDLGTSNFTFMVWEKSHASTYPNVAVILSNRPNNAAWKGYIFGVVSSGAQLYTTAASGQVTNLVGTKDVTDNTWHHIAYRRQGTNHSLYVDGAYDTSTTGTIRNITNTLNNYFSYENRADWYHFDGLIDEAQLYNRTLSPEEIKASYNNGLYRLYHNFTGLADGSYEFYAHAINTSGHQGTTETRQVTIDTVSPTIINVSNTPDTVGFGSNITINTNATDSGSGISHVDVTIDYPEQKTIEPDTITMNHLTADHYQYTFTDTWFNGQYNYTITAYDNANNTQDSTGHHFNVSSNATISIATLKDYYEQNEYVNLTDPPNPTENLTIVGRGLTWNTYYNATSGANILDVYQAPVNYQNQTSDWTPINTTLSMLPESHPAYHRGYRLGDAQGLYGAYFKPTLNSDWPVAFSYTQINDPAPLASVKLQPMGIGYLDPVTWTYQQIQTIQTTTASQQENTVTYPGIFTDMDISWSYTNTRLKEELRLNTNALIRNYPPTTYGLTPSAFLVLTSKLDITGLSPYNGLSPITTNLTIMTGGIDFKDTSHRIWCSAPIGEAYEATNSQNNVQLTYRIIQRNNEWYLLTGLPVSTLNSLSFPVVIDPTLTIFSNTSDGYIYTTDANYNTARDASTGTIADTINNLYIGQYSFHALYTIYRGFLMFNTTALPSNAYIDNAVLSVYKYTDSSTTDFSITLQNGQPTYPHNPLQTTDYNKSHYSGDGGSFNTSMFTTGYNNITLNSDGKSWLNKTGWTKLCLRSNKDVNGSTPTNYEFVRVYSSEQGSGYQPKLTITYRNQSKIKNTGTTDIQGYLSIQLWRYNATTSQWTLANDTINETTPRTLSSGQQLGLDTVFNGHITTDDLGYGEYRVIARLRDSEGNTLRVNGNQWLEATWTFSYQSGT